MKKITKLTDEQKKMMETWADPWIEKALKTGEADWEGFERGARACYTHAGLAQPKAIIRVQSPLVLTFAGPMASSVLAHTPTGRGKGKLTDRMDTLLNGVKSPDVSNAIKVQIKRAVREILLGCGVIPQQVDAPSAEDMLQTVRNEWYRYLGGQFWLSWQAYTSFFKACGLELPGDLWQRDADYALAQESACWWWPHEQFIVVSNRPQVIALEKIAERGWASRRLHNDKGPALAWRDWEVYFLHGVRVEPWIVNTPAEQLDPLMFAKLTNVEIRREFVRKVGIERLCQKLGTKVLDRDGDYELHLVNLGGATGEWPYLKMRNPSIGVYHMEAVERGCTTVAEALRFRNGGDIEHIAPIT